MDQVFKDPTAARTDPKKKWNGPLIQWPYMTSTTKSSKTGVSLLSVVEPVVHEAIGGGAYPNDPRRALEPITAEESTFSLAGKNSSNCEKQNALLVPR